MRIKKHRKNHCWILTLEGTIDSAGAEQAEKELNTAVGTAEEAYILDLSGLVFISSAGLRVLLLLAKKIDAANGRLSLCALPAHVRDVFDIAGFALIFDIRNNINAAMTAVAAMSKGGAK